MKALLAALPCLLAALLGAATEEPSPPQNLPIIYDEIGGKFILRIDNRRYQLESVFKDPVARLLADANYARAKLAHESYRRALADKAKAEASIARLEATAQRLGLATERARLNLESARNQLALYRSTPPVDPTQLAFLQEQVLRAQSQLLSAEDQENRARGKLDEGRRAAEPANERAEKARLDYADALTEYERPLAQLRALALASGTAL
ncbi:hypothetical protein EBR16_06605 [bacterium]|jgi:hypothetical protein|nr:hypothetical protein [bacterium]